MIGFRGPGAQYAGVAGADLENAPSGPVPFTSPYGMPVARLRTWFAGGGQPGSNSEGVPGTPTQRASGNPDVATAPSYGPEKSPYGGDGPVGSGGSWPQFGVARTLSPDQESATPRQPPVGSAQDKLITYDRHGMMKVGYENSGRNSGVTDPPSDGPARPSLWLVQRTVNYQQGSDNTGNQDDLTRSYTRNAQGMYVGEQGAGWSRVYGGVPGLWQPYGSYEGVTNGPVRGIQSPIGEGQPGDGPRTVWSGPPHGLHSPTLPSYDQTLGRYQAIPQMSVPRQDRPSNSPIAGQSYSQTVIPQGQAGTAVAGTGPSGPQWFQRKPGNGWRGRGQA